MLDLEIKHNGKPYYDRHGKFHVSEVMGSIAVCGFNLIPSLSYAENKPPSRRMRCEKCFAGFTIKKIKEKIQLNKRN